MEWHTYTNIHTMIETQTDSTAFSLPRHTHTKMRTSIRFICAMILLRDNWMDVYDIPWKDEQQLCCDEPESMYLNTTPLSKHKKNTSVLDNINRRIIPEPGLHGQNAFAHLRNFVAERWLTDARVCDHRENSRPLNYASCSLLYPSDIYF